ncbi:MAG: AAA family ATPase [Candidatus Methanoperedens sp.]|nr:AAA family ATPase [Candidatus Methanoperedens sp.]
MDKIEINRFRGIEEYTIKSFGNWSSITGPNSSNKSTIINAISLLGSYRMHDISDIPSWYDLNLVNPREIPIKVKYLFRLNESFDKLVSDSRIKETLVSLYEEQLNRTIEDYKAHLEAALRSLRNDGPLSQLLNKALYEAIRREFEFKSQYEPYKPLFYSDGRFKMPDEIFEDVKFLEINLEMSLSDGPEYKFSFLDERENTIIDDEVFYHWLKYQNAIDDKISLAFVIGAVFIKSIINSQPQEDEATFPPTILASDGSNIKKYIEYSLTHHPNIFTNIGDNFKKLFGHTMQVKKASIANHIEENEILIRFGGDGDWFPIDKLSDGMLRLLRLFLQLATSKKGDILVIDEPELHLHPGAAKSLREILVGRKSEIQIIVATHSPIFLDSSVADVIILNQNIKNSIVPKILESKEIDLALSELGSTGLDALLYDVIIWVEGPSDKIYLEKWLNLLLNENEITISSQIGILPYGGKSLLMHLKIEEIKLINRKSIFIIDSDKKSENEEIDPDTRNFISICNKNNINYWLTERRAIENYIPLNILERKLNINPGIMKITRFDDVFESLKKIGRNNIGKVELAKIIASGMTNQKIRDDIEFYEEIQKNIVQKIVKYHFD